MPDVATETSSNASNPSTPPARRINVTSRNLRAIGQIGPVAALVLLAVFFAIYAPSFVSMNNLTVVLQQTSITAIAAVGATAVILVAGIDLSVGSVVALTGTFGALYLEHSTLGNGLLAAVVAVIVTLATATLCGLLNGLIVTRVRVPAFVATLATLTSLRGLALLTTDSNPVSITDSSYTWIGLGQIGPVPISIIVMAGTFGIGYLILHRLTIGRRIYAVGGNAEAARLSGIKVDRVLLFVFMFAGLCAGISAVILTAKLSSGQPAGSVGFELDVIAAVVIGGTSLFGGRGRLSGTFLGALLLGVLINGLTLMDVASYWQQIVTGLVVVIAVGLDRLTQEGPTRE